MSRDPEENDEREQADATDYPGDRKAVSTPTVEHQWTDTVSPCTSIIEAVAAATDRQPTDLPTLDARIDGDALDTLLLRGSPSLTISFEYAGTVVLARGDGTVRVTVTDCTPASSND
jgi:hypothetical protein